MASIIRGFKARYIRYCLQKKKIKSSVRKYVLLSTNTTNKINFRKAKMRVKSPSY